MEKTNQQKKDGGFDPNSRIAISDAQTPDIGIASHMTPAYHHYRAHSVLYGAYP